MKLRVAASIALASLTLAACSSALPASSEPAASESVVPSASMRAFGDEDVTALLLRDGDLAGGMADYGGLVRASAEWSDVAWQQHLDEHGLLGRWWSGTSSAEELSLGYGYIAAATVSLWADAEAAAEALAFENSTPRPGIGILASLEAPGLGDGAWCGVLDWGPNLDDRGWCRFAVANATFDLYIRTGDELDPRASGDLADLALRLRQRAESVAATPQPIAEGRLAELTDARYDHESGSDGGGRVPDLRTVTLASTGGELVFDLAFADVWDDPIAYFYITIADPDTVPPNGPPPGSRAPYCSPYEGPYILGFSADGARVNVHDWETDRTDATHRLDSTVDRRHVRITIPPDLATDIVHLGSGSPKLSFSIAVARDVEHGEGFDYFPSGNDTNCTTVDLVR